MAFRALVVAGAGVQIAAFQPLRTAITIKNLGPARCFIGQDLPDLAVQGFALDTGEYLSLIASDGDDPRTGLYAITAGLNADLRIEESFQI